MCQSASSSLEEGEESEKLRVYRRKPASEQVRFTETVTPETD